MSEDVVGSAYVTIRAITDKIKKDIADGVKKGAKDGKHDNEAAGDEIGDDIGKAAGKKVGDRITEGIQDGAKRNRSKHKKVGEDIADDVENGLNKKGIFSRFASALGNIFKDNKTKGADKEFGNGIGSKIFQGITEGIGKVPLKPFFLAMLVPALAGVLHILAAYVASAVSLLSSLGPALTGTAVGFIGLYAAVGQAAGAVMLAFKTQSKALDDFKLQLGGVKEGFHQIGLNVQKALFPSLISSVNLLARDYLPILNKNLVGTGQVVGGLAMRFAGVMDTPFMKGAFNDVMKENNVVLGRVGVGLIGFVKAFVLILKAGKPVIDVVSKFVERMGLLAGESAQAGIQTGKLTAFFDRAATSMHQWGLILGNFGKAFFNIFKLAVPAGKQLTDGIQTMSGKFLAFTQSVNGQNKIKAFFDQAVPVVQAFNHLIGDISKAFGKGLVSPNGNAGLINFINLVDQKLLPIFVKLVNALAANGGGLTALFNQLVNIFTTLANSGAFGSFIGTLNLFLKIVTDILKLPFIPQLLGMALAFGGVTKAVDLLLKPFGGLKVITGPLSKALFGVGDQAGLISGPLGKLKDAVKDLMGKAKDKALDKLSDGLSGIGKGAKAAAGGIKSALSASKDFIKTTLISTATVLKNIAVFVGQKVAALASAAAAKVMAAAEWLLNAAMDANPLTLVVAAIVALVAIFVVAWNHSETFRKIVTGVFKAVWDAIKAVWNWIKDNWPLLLAILTGPIGVAVLLIVKNWDKIKNGFKAVFDFLKKVWDWAVRNIFDPIVSAFEGIGSTISGVFQGLTGTIMSILKGLVDAAIGVVNGGIWGINQLIHAFNSATQDLSDIWSWSGIPSIPKIPDIPSIPYLANGGRATRATLAMIGEGREPESVLPDSVLGGLLSRAHNAGAALGNADPELVEAIMALASRPIVLKVNDREIARANISGSKKLVRTA